jgi:hypothetical protein
MSDADKEELYRLVRGWVLTPGYPTRKHVKECIQDAHLGRPDGYLVTNDNQWMFRQYRNSVSPSVDQLVREAVAFEEVSDATS